MAKEATTYPLALPQHGKRSQPAYQWLYESLRAEILGGRLSPGVRLPATRDLARQYGLARGTVVSAFEQLASEGYVEGTVGSGTFVSKALPEALLQIVPGRSAETRSARRETSAAVGKRAIAGSRYASCAKLFAGYENRPTRAFRANLPALDLFPVTLWAKIAARRMRRISTRDLMGCEPLGYPPLRQAVSEYLTASRGVRCAPEQIAIVSGVQEALDLVARLLVDPGDRVCLEDPGYPGAAQVFLAYQARVITVGMDNEGVSIEKLPRRGVRLIYVTPGHQFPLGATMPLARRLQLLEWARKSSALIFEDDYDSEYRYRGRPIPALQGLDVHGSVIYAGSFSKVLFPSLRLGYVVIPAPLVRQFEAAISLTVRHTALLEQLVLSDFINEGHFSRHLRRMREIYAERLAVLLDEARAKLEGLLEISPIEAGLQTVGWLRNGISAEAAATVAAKRNIDVTPLARYSQNARSASALQLGFAAIDAREIRRGVRDLAASLQSIAKTPR